MPPEGEPETRIGVVYRVQPEPWDPERTQWIEAGAVRLGLESREVDPQRLAEAYGDSAEDLAEIEANSPAGGFTDEGLSIHVVGTADGHEYLRFDLFEGEPHYHYVRPSGDHNHWVPFDPVAGGDMTDFAITALRERLGPMLRAAGGESVVERLDPERQRPGIDELERRIAALRARGV